MSDNEALVQRARTAIRDGAQNHELLTDLADALEAASLRPRRAEIKSEWNGPDWNLAGEAAFRSPIQRTATVTIEDPTGNLYAVEAKDAHISVTTASPLISN